MKFCKCGHAEREHKGMCCGEACFLCKCREFEEIDECACREGEEPLEEENGI